LCRYAEPTFEEEEEVIDGDFSGSMFGLIDNDKDRSSKAAMGGVISLDKALSKVRQELDKQLTKAGADSGLTSEVAAALGRSLDLPLGCMALQVSLHQPRLSGVCCTHAVPGCQCSKQLRHGPCHNALSKAKQELVR